MDMREESLEVRDVKARLLRKGEGPTVLFLHGASGLPVWGPFFEDLSRRHEVIVMEHPGFGKTEAPAWIRTVSDVAVHYLDVLDALDRKTVHVVGHSLGGWIAAEAAARDCARIASLSLIAPAGLRVKGLPSGDNFIWGPEETVRNLVFDQRLAEQMLGREISDEEADIQLTNRFMAVKLGWEPRWYNPALQNWLHRITAPTQIVWGADDRLFPAAYGDLWRDSIAGAALTVVPQCGHLPHIEKAGLTADVVASFINGATS